MPPLHMPLLNGTKNYGTLYLEKDVQLFNVFKGNMSLVGPRPEMPFIVEQYNEIQRVRLRVLPGITGLWQLSGDRKKAIHENMEYDLYYNKMYLFSWI